MVDNHSTYKGRRLLADNELDERGNTKEGGIQVEGAVMMPSYEK